MDSNMEKNEIHQSFNIKTLKVNWEGNKNSFMHVFIDTTDIMKLEEANNNIRCQKIMFASASHEFRTPLNAILNSFKFVEGMWRDVQDELHALAAFKSRTAEMAVSDKFKMMERFIGMGTNSSILMLSLVEDILDLSKLESDTFTVNKSVFKVDNLISEVQEVFQHQWDQKRIALEIGVGADLRDMLIVSDRGRLKQVLLNLMSNSYKFTFRGKISLKAKIVPHRDKQYIEFWIKDTGIGIKDEDQPKLFALFGMISESKSINPNGCGIGLTVSKKYIEKLGGQIRLESKWEEGTTIRFTVELQLPQIRSTNDIDHLGNRFEPGELIDEADILLPNDDFFEEKNKFLLPLTYTGSIMPHRSHLLEEKKLRQISRRKL